MHASISSSPGRKTRMSPRIEELWMEMAVYETRGGDDPYSGAGLHVVGHGRGGIAVCEKASWKKYKMSTGYWRP